MPKYDLRKISQSMQANRSQIRPLLEDEELMGLTNNELKAEQAARDEELKALSEIASLTNHPGYQKMRKTRLETIRQYRSGEHLVSALSDASISNEQLGELTRVGLIVADTLERELLTVEEADKVVEEERKKGRRGRTERPEPESD